MSRKITISGFIIITLILAVIVMIRVWDRQADRKLPYHKKEFNDMVDLIKSQKIAGVYDVGTHSGSINLTAQQQDSLDRLLYRIHDVSEISISQIGDSLYFISFQFETGSWEGSDHFLYYYDINFPRDEVYSSDYQSSRMKIKIVDKNWVMVTEYPNTGKWN